MTAARFLVPLALCLIVVAIFVLAVFQGAKSLADAGRRLAAAWRDLDNPVPEPTPVVPLATLSYQPPPDTPAGIFASPAAKPTDAERRPVVGEQALIAEIQQAQAAMSDAGRVCLAGRALCRWCPPHLCNGVPEQRRPGAGS